MGERQHEPFVAGGMGGRFAHSGDWRASKIRTNLPTCLAFAVEVSRCCKAPATVGGRYRARRLSRAPLIRQCRLRGKSSKPYLLYIRYSQRKPPGSALRNRSCTVTLGELNADGGSQRVGYGLAEALYVGLMFGFDHYPGQGFGAGIAQDDAAIVAERGLGFG